MDSKSYHDGQLVYVFGLVAWLALFSAGILAGTVRRRRSVVDRSGVA